MPRSDAGKKTEETVVTLTDDAQQAFSARALDVENPFNLIAGTEVIVRSGTTIPPKGNVALTVTGRVTVKF